MIGLHLITSLVALMAIGALLERVLLFRAAQAPSSAWELRFFGWALLGIAATYLVSTRSLWALLVPCTLMLLHCRAPAASAGHPPKGGQRRASLVVATLLLLATAWSLARPQVPLAWDEFVWIGKAQIEGRDGWGALTAAALIPGQEVFPAGYPLLWSLLPAWFARSGSLPALALGFGGAKLVYMGAFAFALPTICRPSQVAQGRLRTMLLVAAGVISLLTPLFVAHIRFLYADAPVGLLAATLTLTFLLQSQHARATGSTAALIVIISASLTVVLCGLKDEGAGHVAAISLAALVFGPKSLRRTAVLALAVAGIVTVSWHLKLASHGIANTDHALDGPALSAIGAVAKQLMSDATDPLSWGVLWPITAAAVLFLLLTPRSKAADSPDQIGAGDDARFVAWAFVAQALMLHGALLLGPERVRIFALNGTLINRLLIQLTPAATLVLMTLADRLARSFHRAQATDVTEAAHYGV